MTITDEQFDAREREIADLFGFLKVPLRTASRSEERIERILRRARLENRIHEAAGSKGANDRSEGESA